MKKQKKIIYGIFIALGMISAFIGGTKLTSAQAESQPNIQTDTKYTDAYVPQKSYNYNSPYLLSHYDVTKYYINETTGLITIETKKGLVFTSKDIILMKEK